MYFLIFFALQNKSIYLSNPLAEANKISTFVDEKKIINDFMPLAYGCLGLIGARNKFVNSKVILNYCYPRHS